MLLRGSQWLYQSVLECRSWFDVDFQGFSGVLSVSQGFSVVFSGSQGFSRVLTGSQGFSVFLRGSQGYSSVF